MPDAARMLSWSSGSTLSTHHSSSSSLEMTLSLLVVTVMAMSLPLGRDGTHGALCRPRYVRMAVLREKREAVEPRALVQRAQRLQCLPAHDVPVVAQQARERIDECRVAQCRRGTAGVHEIRLCRNRGYALPGFERVLVERPFKGHGPAGRDLEDHGVAVDAEAVHVPPGPNREDRALRHADLVATLELRAGD